MPHIQQLDPHVADLIAAGEVVERPASVVKELMENAIDAGASALTVEIQHGGMTLIRVTDNGCGIAAGEAQTAFLRHATSKIRSEYDLEAIGTLGFRGEALAAIAAVSRVELFTRTGEEELGIALSLEGGEVTGREEAGCPQGTTLVVRDLFYNTPARLKFMKKDAAEGAACFAMVQRVALSNPQVSVRFLRDGRQELHTPGDGALRSAVYAVLGREIALGLLPVQGTGEEMEVSGFTSLPACCRGTRGYQHFFVNGRYVKSRTMTAALEEAYANQKMVGKFPSCVLHLRTKLNAVDVNVHPTKQEVKFGSDKKVFDTVYCAVRAALEGNFTHPGALSSREGGEKRSAAAPQSRPAAPRPSNAGELSAALLPLGDFTAPRARRSTPAPWARTLRREAADARQAGRLTRERWEHTPGPAQAPAEEVPAQPRAAAPEQPPAQSALLSEEAGPRSAEHSPGEDRPAQAQPAPSQSGDTPPAQPETLTPQPEIPPWRLAGQVLDTYIIVEQGDKVLLIDKHAAHERMHFDRLKAGDYAPMVQQLLTPLVFTPPAEEGAALLDHLELLARFGFEVSDFGGGAIAVRTAPDDVGAGEIPDTLCQLAAQLLSTGRADPEQARDALLHTMACKSAIKGGQKNSPQELERVAQAVMSGQVKYCPHGRPVAIELTRAQLEKRFGRA